MNQIAQGAVVATVGDRALKRRRSQSTETAAAVERLALGLYGVRQGLTADGAIRAGQWPKGREAIVTNGKPGNLDQRGTTDTAIGGEKRKKQAGSSALCPADDRMDRCCGPGNPYSKASTAEDGLPHPAGLRGRTGRHQFSIAAPTRCGWCASERRPVDFSAACARVGAAPAQQK